MTRLTRPLVSTIALSLAGVTTQAALADDATLDFGVPDWGAYLKKVIQWTAARAQYSRSMWPVSGANHPVHGAHLTTPLARCQGLSGHRVPQG